MSIISLNNIEYEIEDGIPVVYLFGRDENGILRYKKDDTFRPFFYARQDIISENIIKKEKGFKSIRGEDLIKFTCKIPENVGKLRTKVDYSYESDILFPLRYIISKRITKGFNLETLEPVDAPPNVRICHIDIEVDPRGMKDIGQSWRTPDQDILAVTVFDTYLNKYISFLYTPNHKGKTVKTKWNSRISDGTYDWKVFIIPDRKDFLNKILDYFEDNTPDLITGWNVNFDMRYLIAYMNKHHVATTRMSLIRRVYVSRSGDVIIKGCTVLDLLKSTREFLPSEEPSWKLGKLAKSKIGVGKIYFGGGIGELWDKTPEKLLQYNVGDVELTLGIDLKYNILGYYNEIRRQTGCQMRDSIFTGRVIDAYKLRKARDKGIVLPKKGQTKKGLLKGAIVLDLTAGLKRDVVMLDLEKLYPMCMRTLNISPDTIDPAGDLIAPNGIRFRSDVEGFNQEILREFIEKRNEMKAKMKELREKGDPDWKRMETTQFVYKQLTNAFYGDLAFEQSRTLDMDCANAVTSMARRVLSFTIDYVNDNFSNICKIIYGDTDSVFLQVFSGNCIETGLQIEKVLNHAYDKLLPEIGAKQHFFKIKMEKVYKTFIQIESDHTKEGVKKRYAGWKVWAEGVEVDEIEVVGFEVKRSDASAATRDFQEEVLTLILRGNRTELKKYLVDFIGDMRAGLENNDPTWIEYTGIPTALTKAISKYKTNTIQTRTATYSNNYLDTSFGMGDKFLRTYIREVPRGLPKTDAIAFDVATQIKGFKIDVEMLVDKTLKKKVERILKAATLSWDEIVGGYRQKTIFEL